MAMKYREIVMNGNTLGSYKIGFISYVKLMCIRFWLWILRWSRRCGRGLSYCKYALGIIPFWGIYVVIVYFWGKLRPTPYALIDILWDMKTSFFTSVVLAAITAFITQYSKKKNAYLEQHRIYTKVMSNSSQLYKDLFRLLCKDSSKEHVPFWPFYTKGILETVFNQSDKYYATDKKSIEYECAVKSIDELRQDMRMLESTIYTGILAECNVLELNRAIDSCNSGLANLARLLEAKQYYPHWDICLSMMANRLFKLIELLRTPWRKDLKYRTKVLQIIYRDDPSVASVFYNSALLDVIDYPFYESVYSPADLPKQNVQKVKVRRKTHA